MKCPTLSAAVNLLLKQVNTWWLMHNTMVPWSGLKMESPLQSLTELGTGKALRSHPFFSSCNNFALGLHGSLTSCVSCP
jgi:hypothetical protein